MLARARKYSDKPYYLGIICSGVPRYLLSLFRHSMVWTRQIGQLSFDNDIRGGICLILGHKQNADDFFIKD
jgi:hypothetical protein